MALDLQLLGSKIRRYREQFEASQADVAAATGIAVERLEGFEAGRLEPSGDEVLILADYFKCDFKFFISNDRVAPFDETETLFRRIGDKITKEDRWAIQEFLFLCEGESFLQSALDERVEPFTFEKRGNFYKGHAVAAASSLRQHLGIDANAVSEDIFLDFRRLGIHVFRRRISNPDISGLYVRHPTAGACVLVNYQEDPFRQRFTVAHEAGHAILDAEEDVVISTAWDRKDLVEVRANKFASEYLLPEKVLSPLRNAPWTPEFAREIAVKLRVNIDTLAIRLKDLGVVDQEAARQLRAHKVPRSDKTDTELGSGLTDRTRARKQDLLERGLSTYYVRLGLRAYEAGMISYARLADLLMVAEAEVLSIVRLYDPNWRGRHDA